jgi:2,3-bisphosphoglycerate-dependent phosphoglycerate mutase
VGYYVSYKLRGAINMLDLVIVRHGQSVADVEERMEGRADFPLTNLGKEQARKLAHWLKENTSFDYIISSPLKRASETAEIINKLFNIEITYDERLMEWNNGVLAGLLRSEAYVKYPIPEGGRKYFERINGGESIIDFRARAEDFTAELIDKYFVDKDDKRILIVAHGGIINMIFQSFLSLPIENDITISSGDTGVHRLRLIGDKRVVVSLNGNEHLKLIKDI